MGKARKSLVQKLIRSADSNMFELPKSWHVLSRYRTAELFLKHPSPPAVRYNDAPLYNQLVRQHPQVKLQPTRLNSPQPSLATRVVADHRQQLRQELRQAEQQQQQQQQQQPQQQVEQQWQQQGPQPSADQQQQVQVSGGWKLHPKVAQELEKAGRETSSTGFLEYIQQQEEEALQAALQRLKQQEAQVLSERKSS